jgi:UPF0755 protein
MQLSRGSKVFLVVLVLFGGAVIGGLFVLDAGDTDAEPGRPVTVEVTEGMGTGEVAGVLADAGVIDNVWAFRLSARFDERGGRIRPGTYDLRTSMETDEILTVLSAVEETAPNPTFAFTIPEGLTVPATLERIAAADGSPFSVEELEEALVAVALPEWVPDEGMPEGAQEHEGLLFPATYEFYADQDAQEVLAELIAKTDAELRRVDEPEHLSLYEVLIVASLIEREVRVPEERETVSAVIRNRIASSMRLQVDATVQYARGEHTGRLLFDDLRIDSAWNTYESDGLPPTPIAGAGRAAIEAAAYPTDSDYHFYVVCDTSTGEHVFAEDHGGHQRNVARYREIQEGGGRFCDDD